MDTTATEWRALLERTRRRWVKAQHIVRTGGLDELFEYLGRTDCPLCAHTRHICRHCITVTQLGKKCFELESVRKFHRAETKKEAYDAIKEMVKDLTDLIDDLAR